MNCCSNEFDCILVESKDTYREISDSTKDG